MQRVCFVLQVKPERLEEYKERHRTVWPEMQAALRETHTLPTNGGGAARPAAPNQAGSGIKTVIDHGGSALRVGAMSGEFVSRWKRRGECSDNTVVTDSHFALAVGGRE